MNAIILAIALTGQLPIEPAGPWQDEKDRLAWIQYERINRAYAAAQERRARIAANRAYQIERRFTAVSGLPWWQINQPYCRGYTVEIPSGATVYQSR